MCEELVRTLSLPQVGLSGAEAREAAEEWGANCGPGALAVATARTLEEVRAFLEGFDGKRYTNPLMMLRALDAMGVGWERLKPPRLPLHGLARIQ